MRPFALTGQRAGDSQEPRAYGRAPPPLGTCAQVDRDVKTFEEGQEPPEFWEFLGGL